MARWYRAYEGTVTDPKLAEAAMMCACSRSVAVAAWHLILESAAVANDRGQFDCSPRRISAALCEPLATVEALMDAFTEIGLVRGSVVAAWDRRQFHSDTSAERTARYRARKKGERRGGDDDVTSRQRVGDGPYTETETEYSVADATGAAAPKSDDPVSDPHGGGSFPADGRAPAPVPSAADFTRIVFATGVTILKAAGQTDRQARSIIGRWRSTYTDSALIAVLSRCEQMQPSEPVAWIMAALASEARRASGERNGKSQEPARGSGLRSIAQRVAEKLEAAEVDYADRC